MRHSLLLQLWSVFSLILLLLLFAVFGLTTWLFNRQFGVVFQHIYFEAADEFAHELQPLLKSFDAGQISNAFQRFESRDPRIALFLLDQSGRILAETRRGAARAGQSSLEMIPIKRFLAQTDGLTEPILLRTATSGRFGSIFSASAVRLENQPGFLVALIDSKIQSRVLLYNETSRPTLFFLLCVFSSSAVAWVVFSVITRRISQIGTALKRFAQGDFAYRLPLKGGDELSRYVSSFNFMADRAVSAMRTLSGIQSKRREMFANISHDLRRPMASIINTLETLADESVPFEEVEETELLRLATKRAEDLKALVSSVSELSALDRPMLSVQRTLIPLDDELRYLVAAFDYLAKQRGISLSFVPGGETIVLPGEVNLLRRAVANLIENALLYTEQGGEVTVSYLVAEGKARLKVADTGCGIPPEELGGIFTPFGRGSQARAQNKPGTGLGLSIAKQIIELHGGALRVDSQVGIGSEFVAEFPLQ